MDIKPLWNLRGNVRSTSNKNWNFIMKIVTCSKCGKSNHVDPNRAQGRVAICGNCRSALPYTQELPKKEDFEFQNIQQIKINLSNLIMHLINENEEDDFNKIENIIKNRLNIDPINFIKKIKFSINKPVKNKPYIPKEPQSPREPRSQKPVLPTTIPLPIEPKLPVSMNFANKIVYSIKHASWEKEFNEIKAINDKLLHPIINSLDFFLWEEHEKNLKIYEQNIAKWRKYSLEEHSKEEKKYNIDLENWNKQKYNFDEVKNITLDAIIRIANLAQNGDSIALGEYLSISLYLSNYPKLLTPKFTVICDIPSNLVLIEFYVPSFGVFEDCIVADQKKSASKFSLFHNKKEENRKQLGSAKNRQKLYDKYIYGIILRSAWESFSIKQMSQIHSIAMNIKTQFKSPSNGHDTIKNFATIMIAVDNIKNIDIDYVDPEAFFKHNKGISGINFTEAVEVPPIIRFDKNDNRFVDGRMIASDKNENLAEMDWEDFEHLVRQLFESHFKGKNAEVHLTRSSRDRGVDAIIFDSDPITGGKIVIQAKRYTKTVEVAAVRELFGTTQNEGANKGILVTTSNFGSDSYEFAKDKNITLINGTQLISLLKEHGFSYSLDIKQARRNMGLQN